MGRCVQLAVAAVAAGGLVSAPDDERARKGGDAEQRVRETRAGVTVTKVFPGAILKPERPTMPPETGPVVVQDVYCPFCHGTNVLVTWKGDTQRSFRCYTCVDPETGDWTVFKLPRRRPPPLKRAGAPSPSPRAPSSSRSPSPPAPRPPRG